MGGFDRRLCNVLCLGVGFMLVFTAFQTMGIIQKTVLTSIEKDTPDFSGDGYISLAIIYVMFSVCIWFAPSFISLCGPRVSMAIGSLGYAFFIASFLVPMTWLLYLASVVIGCCAAIIWTGQGNYLTLNSDSTTISRNSGIFWAILQSSMFFGNLFVFFQFQGKEHIDKGTRMVTFTVLTVVCCIGVVVLFLLRHACDENGEPVENEKTSPLDAFVKASKLFFTKDMLLLDLVFIYTGFELTFYSGVYSTCLGFTKDLGPDNKRLVGLSGIFIGAGEVLGGLLFGILGSKTTRFGGRTPVVALGFFLHVVAFILIGLNLPNESPLVETSAKAIITSRAWLAIMCSFLLGFGDSCYNTQVISILGGLYSDNSPGAFAIFKFAQSVSCAVGFLYSNVMGLYYQLLLMLVFSVIGSCAFFVVEVSSRRREREQHRQ